MRPVVAILGPTATGKTEVSVALAKVVGAEVVNADALQVYRGLDIGTAKPTLEERAGVPHHLIDILDPSEPYSAGEFARRAFEYCQEIDARGGTSLVVGGSGLYQRALFQGLAELPQVSAEVRDRLDLRVRSEGLAALYRQLEILDPVSARRLAPGDRQRITRALEIAIETGRPLSEWLKEQRSSGDRIPVIRFGLTLSRPILYDRIESRVYAMLERGWVEEVARLLETGVPPGAPAFQAIGYREIVGYLGGETTLEAATADIMTATRRYAKRQETWFKAEPRVRWFDADDRESMVDAIAKQLTV